MKSKASFVKRFAWMTVACVCFPFVSCNDSNEPMGKGEAEFAITDAASDDANISGVFVTVTDIKVNGESFEGFSGKQTINLMAYQNGNTKVLGTGELSSRTYGNVTLVLDMQSDADGNEPGCYVLTNDQQKFNLNSTSNEQMELALNKDWTIKNGMTNAVVFDFDLRKSIRRDDNPEKPYQFVSSADLKSAVRVINADESGTIAGSYEESVATGADKVIVYAYHKGDFNAATETNGDMLFSHAVASTMVKSSLSGNSYTLAFLEGGDYELHFASYDEDSQTSRTSFDALLESEIMIDGSAVNTIHVDAGAQLSLEAMIIGLL